MMGGISFQLKNNQNLINRKEFLLANEVFVSCQPEENPSD
jgi:hypothetical protein